MPTDKLALYERLIATNPKIVRKGATNPYTSLNGHMFSHLVPPGTLALRLPDPLRSEFLKKYKTKLLEAWGVVKKDWVVVPDSMLKDTKKLKKYFDASYEYVKSMKPKAK